MPNKVREVHTELIDGHEVTSNRCHDFLNKLFKKYENEVEDNIILCVTHGAIVRECTRLDR